MSACPVFSPYVARLFLSGLNRIKQVSLLWAYLRILASLTHESTLDNLFSDNLLSVVRVRVASRAYKGFKQKPDLCIYYTFLGDFEYIILCNNITVFEKKYTRGFLKLRANITDQRWCFTVTSRLRIIAPRNRSRRLLILTMTEQLTSNGGPLLDIVEVHYARAVSLKIHTVVVTGLSDRIVYRFAACIIDRVELIYDVGVLISKASTGVR